MNEPFDSDLAVATLTAAWKSGSRLAALPESARPPTLAEGYDVQDRFVANIESAYGGWKLGVGSHKQKLASGIGRAIAGRVLSSCMFDPGDAVLLPNDAPVTVEFEVAFVLKRDVLPDEEIEDPLAVVGDVRLTAELVLSRFEDRRSVGWPSFAADNAGFQALVVGPLIDCARLDELRSTLVVEVDGRERARAAMGEDETDPAQALMDLIMLARERQFVLPKASIISTGTQSLPFDVAGAASIAARCCCGELAFRMDVGKR